MCFQTLINFRLEFLLTTSTINGIMLVLYLWLESLLQTSPEADCGSPCAVLSDVRETGATWDAERHSSEWSNSHCTCFYQIPSERPDVPKLNSIFSVHYQSKRHHTSVTVLERTQLSIQLVLESSYSMNASKVARLGGELPRSRAMEQHSNAPDTLIRRGAYTQGLLRSSCEVRWVLQPYSYKDQTSGEAGQNCPVLRGTRRSITVFTKAHH